MSNSLTVRAIETLPTERYHIQDACCLLGLALVFSSLNESTQYYPSSSPIKPDLAKMPARLHSPATFQPVREGQKSHLNPNPNSSPISNQAPALSPNRFLFKQQPNSIPSSIKASPVPMQLQPISIAFRS